jgi:hypothetical protein
MIMIAHSTTAWNFSPEGTPRGPMMVASQ